MHAHAHILLRKSGVMWWRGILETLPEDPAQFRTTQEAMPTPTPLSYLCPSNSEPANPGTAHVTAVPLSKHLPRAGLGPAPPKHQDKGQPWPSLQRAHWQEEETGPEAGTVSQYELGSDGVTLKAHGLIGREKARLLRETFSQRRGNSGARMWESTRIE